MMACCVCDSSRCDCVLSMANGRSARCYRAAQSPSVLRIESGRRQHDPNRSLSAILSQRKSACGEASPHEAGERTWIECHCLYERYGTFTWPGFQDAAGNNADSYLGVPVDTCELGPISTRLGDGGATCTILFREWEHKLPIAKFTLDQLN